MNSDTCVNRAPLTTLVLFVARVSIPMIIWIVLADLKRPSYHLKMHS